ncbi:Phenylacetic acid catabolic protein [Candidatus Nephthysia bennettiae]|uniref:Phenylacetic acid catabolic protein n=1 Tax=Candidatus Nephthysia bennettiae TaxID=3127016 RepID=UPI0030C6B552
MTLGTLVLSLADNKQLLGLRYAEWAIRAPSLEADIAAAAMGLDDIGHSRVLLGCLEPLGDDPRGPERESDAGAYLNLPYFDEPWTSWSQFVAANAVLDTAFSVMIQAMVDGSVEVLQTRLRKMLMEERYHFLHGRSWLRGGVPDEPLEEAWREAIEWFGPPDGDVAMLQREGKLAAGPTQLVRRLEERLETSAPRFEPEWKGWDPTRRRRRPGSIDGRTFGMLRGLEERRFMPSGASGGS